MSWKTIWKCLTFLFGLTENLPMVVLIMKCIVPLLVLIIVLIFFGLYMLIS